MADLTRLSGGILGERSSEATLHEINGWSAKTPSARIAFMRQIIAEARKDPELAVFTTKILRERGIPPREFQAQAAAILKWVQRNVYYVNEPDERLQTPWRTIKWQAGDCFPEGTLVLRDDFQLVPIEDAPALRGRRIWGHNAWTTVEAWAAKGTLPVTEIRLNNGSTIKLTEDHKVSVMGCEKHGLTCASALGGPVRMCAEKGRMEIQKIRVSELQAGMEMIAPERLPFGKLAADPARKWIEGVYVSDGSMRYDAHGEPHEFDVAGQDGCPKEEQKRRVQRICEARGVATRWARKQIVVKDRAWAQELAPCGRYAPVKRALTIDLTEAPAAALLEGIMADSGANTHGTGRTFTTTSRILCAQTRVLHKMFGKTCSYRYIEKHGGLGKNPIHRLGVRQEVRSDGRAPKRLCVKSIRRHVAVEPCYDIQTSDHFVYLPEADVTVNQCDDLSILVAAMAESIGLGTHLILAGPDGSGRLHRWIEGQGWPSRQVNWSHVYVEIGWPALNPTHWATAEPSMPDAPFGYDVVLHGVMGDAEGRIRVPRQGEKPKGAMVEFQQRSSGPTGAWGQPQVFDHPVAAPVWPGTTRPGEVAPPREEGGDPRNPLTRTFWHNALVEALGQLPGAVISAVVVYFVMRQIDRRSR